MLVDPEVMWDWIKAYGYPFYDHFWVAYGQKEYEFIYGNKFIDDMKSIIEYAKAKSSEEEILTFCQDALKEIVTESSVHFGQPYLNTATMAGGYRMLLKKLASKYDVDLNKALVKFEKTPWWRSYL